MPREVVVLLGDPRREDITKVDGRFSAEDIESVARMKAALAGLEGYAFRYLDDHSRMLAELLAQPPRFVLNLCDTGYRNDAALELHVPAFLEMLGVPCTGAGPSGLARCFDKSLVRAVAMTHGVPVPGELFVAGADPGAELPESWPRLIKPNLGDGSVGITQDSVVRDEEAARECLARLRRDWPGRDALVQEYLKGAEYGVCLIGNPGHGFELLPPIEVDYSGLDPSLPPILGYESKTLPDSPYWKQLRYRRAKIAPEMLARMRAHSELLFERLGCRDYARFDFRLDAAGQAKLLEVNPNCAWCWDGKMMLMAGFDGRSEADVFGLILRAAEQRTNGQSAPLGQSPPGD